MKRIALLCCLLCVSVMGNAVVMINAHVKFGAKKRGCDKGVGICFLLIESRNESDEASVRITLSTDSRNMLIDFPEELIAQYPLQFRNGMFIQEEDFEIPVEILRDLGVSDLVLISAGKYPLQLVDGRQRISIPIAP